MAYISPKFQPEDKTTDREKLQQQFRTQLLGLKPDQVDKGAYYDRADHIQQGGEQATAYEIAKRNKRMQAQLDAQRQALQNYQGSNVDTSVGQGVGPSFNFKPTGNTSFDRFMAAISGQESGGKYGSRNKSSGAMGKYQIMPGNISGSHKGWDYEALGRDVSSSEFMNNPQIQEQIARHKMQQYYNKWGPRGAAIAWYAGPGAVSGMSSKSLNAPQGSYPSINGYAQAILRRLGL
jgi:hypothetical protein